MEATEGISGVCIRPTHINLMGWKACTLHDFYLYLYAAPYLGLLTHFASLLLVAGLERRIFKC